MLKEVHMSISLARKRTPLNSGCLVLLCGVMFLVPMSVAAAAQEPKTNKAQKTPAAASQAEKKPNVGVFALSGTPTPGKQWERPKDVPRFRPLSKERKLEIAQGMQGIPKLAPASATPFLTLYPGRLMDPAGYLELGWPQWDRFAIAHYSLVIDPQHPNEPDETANQEYVELTFKADAGNVYLVDFFVVIQSPSSIPGKRDFQLTVSGLSPSNQQAVEGGNHLTAVFYAQSSGYYTARLRLEPDGNNTSPHPKWGPWFFLAAEVTKFVPAS